MDYTGHGILQARRLKRAALTFSRGIFPPQGLNPLTFSRGSSQPRNWTQVSWLQVDSLPAEPQGKPGNTGVGSLSLLQQIFPTQELNWVLLHCRWILYQLRKPRTTLQSGPRAHVLHLWSTCFFNFNFFNYHTYLFNIILNFIIIVIFPNDCWILWSWKS